MSTASLADPRANLSCSGLAIHGPMGRVLILDSPASVVVSNIRSPGVPGAADRAPGVSGALTLEVTTAAELEELEGNAKWSAGTPVPLGTTAHPRHKPLRNSALAATTPGGSPSGSTGNSLLT